jgi:hypothetical protein
MTSRVKWLLISMFASIVLAGGTALLVTDWALHRHGESHAQDGVVPDFHAWMHAHLDLTPEQHDTLEPVEAEFEQQRVRLRGEIRTAGLEVAAAIGEVAVDDVLCHEALPATSAGQTTAGVDP